MKLSVFAFLFTILLSTKSHCSDPVLEWEYEVNASAMLFGSRIAGGFENNTPVLSEDGMTAFVFSISNEFRPDVGIIHVIAVLDVHGSLVWRGLIGGAVPRVNFLNQDVLVYEIPGFSPARFSTIPLKTVSVTGRGGAQLEGAEGMDAGALMTSSSTRSFLTYTPNPIPDGMSLAIKKWTIAREETVLAPSTFGLEDGNLIISWPTAAGQTYQVQRSTDLESWENIGVALTGNGTTMSYAQPSNADKVFLRVVIP